MASRTCWNCEHSAHQTMLGDPKREAGELTEQSWWSAFYQCDACGRCSLAEAQINPRTFASSSMINYSLQQVVDQSTTLVNIKSWFASPDADLRWLPEHVSGRRFDDVPTPIADAASEAYACHSIRSYRAAILLGRSVVEAIAKDKGIANGTLAAKIDALATADHIRPAIKGSAHEIRHLGNDMAHGDFIQPVDEDDSLDVLEFMSAVLTEVYQLPAQVNARKAKREARKAGRPA